jgi:hypothetical protein
MKLVTFKLLKMRALKNVLLVLCAILMIRAGRYSPEPVTFTGSTPCNGLTMQILAIPSETNCEFVKWKLMLSRDPRNQKPTFFKLNVTYGISKPSTQGFIDGGKFSVIEGNWGLSKNKGKSPGDSIVGLHAHSPDRQISLLELDENLLHLLDNDGKLMIGDASFGYTLNRRK